MATAEATSTRNGLATLSWIVALFGIAAALFLPYVPFLAVVLGGAALVMGAIALGQVNAKHMAGKGAAIAGIVLGILAIGLLLFNMLVIGPAIANTFSTINASLNSVNTP